MGVGRIVFVVALAAGCSGGRTAGAPEPDPEPAVPAPAVPAPADATPAFTLDGLPAWPGDDPAATAVQVHAVDASGELVRRMLTDERAYLVASSDTTVTGRVRAGSKLDAGKALAAAYPDGGLAPPSARAFGGRGRRVDLTFPFVELANVTRLLSSILGVNIALSPRLDGRFSLVARNVPADGVLDAVLAEVGAERARWGKTELAWAKTDAAPDKRFRKLRKPWVDLDVVNARASDVLAALGAVVRVPYAAPCGGGAEVRMRLKGAPLGTALAAVQLLSGETLTESGSVSPCETGELSSLTRERFAEFQLVAVVLTRTKSVAVFRAGDGPPVLVRRGDVAPAGTIEAIGGGFVVFGVGEDREYALLGPRSDARDEITSDSAPWAHIKDVAHGRLAATVVEGDRGSAVVVGADDIPYVLPDTDPGAGDGYRVRVTPGRVVMQDGDTTVADLQLGR